MRTRLLLFAALIIMTRAYDAALSFREQLQQVNDYKAFKSNQEVLWLPQEPRVVGVAAKALLLHKPKVLLVGFQGLVIVNLQLFPERLCSIVGESGR